ncbi:armadillo-type protein [Lipomyces arxii]|uniref:armadillo-type protein n=1 Tax=Lipomyces arxii TaxID=56418 RepID=UPI0034CFF35B
MPREQKKRGRRLKDKPYDKKSVEKEEKTEFQEEADGYDEESSSAGQQAFYGLLDGTQIEYFKEVDEIINANSFKSPAEEEQLYEALWSEIKDIELKVVTDPTGSKAFEQVLLKASQLRLLEIYKDISGKVTELCMQRFSSHCLETLLNCSRSYVSSEGEQNYVIAQIASVDTVNSPVTSAVMDFIAEIKPDIRRIFFHPFGSHVARTLLMMLTGKPLVAKSGSSVLSSKKASKKKAGSAETYHYDSFEPPAVFQQCIKDMVNDLTAHLGLEESRRLALDTVCSPALQLLIEIEDSMMHDHILKIIFPSREAEMDFLTVSYIESLLSAPVGSHFLEKVLYNCPLSFVEYVYEAFFKPRLSIISEAKGFSFVVRALMERLKDKASSQFATELLNGVTNLTLQNIVLLNNVILAVSAHESSTEKVGKKIQKLCDESDINNKLLVLLDLKSFDEISPSRRSHLNDSLKQRCILIENIISHIPVLSEKIVEYFVEFPPDTKIQFCENALLSHAAEAILSKPDSALPIRRKILNDLMGHFRDLACNAGASRIVDACKITTKGLAHYKEQIAQELAANREIVQRNPYGRNVWKNWNMDLYTRSSYDWKGRAKAW